MDFILRVFLFICLSGCLIACNPPTPSVTLHDLQGHNINLADYRDKWIIINYWASWCKPCWQEVAAVNAFYAAHKDKVIVLGVNYDQEPLDQQRDVSKRMQIAFPVLNNDPAALFHLKPVTILPTTFFITPKGEVHRVLPGEQTFATLEAAMIQPRN